MHTNGALPGESPYRALVHAHLRYSVGPLVTDRLRGVGYTVEFVPQDRLATLDDDGGPVVVPATNEAQAQLVRSLRTELGRWLSPVIAVVNDCSGHQSYTAIKYGASGVLNLVIPVEAQLNALHAVLNPVPAQDRSVIFDHSPSLDPHGDQHPVGAVVRQGAGTAPANAASGGILPHLDDHEAWTLIKLLCTDEPVYTIARRFFCSERTMYRRIRALYNSVRVRGRSELRSLIAVRAGAR